MKSTSFSSGKNPSLTLQISRTRPQILDSQLLRPKKKSSVQYQILQIKFFTSNWYHASTSVIIIRMCTCASLGWNLIAMCPFVYKKFLVDCQWHSRWQNRTIGTKPVLLCCNHSWETPSRSELTRPPQQKPHQLPSNMKLKILWQQRCFGWPTEDVQSKRTARVWSVDLHQALFMHLLKMGNWDPSQVWITQACCCYGRIKPKTTMPQKLQPLFW